MSLYPDTLMNTHDIITGSTPLEDRLDGVRPRLFMNAEKLDELKEQITFEPYAGMYRRVIQLADEGIERGFTRAEDGAPIGRGRGTVMPNLALAFFIGGDENYLDAAKESMLAAISFDSWGESLDYGETSFGLSIAYDWLQGHLDNGTLEQVRDALYKCGLERHQFIGQNSGWLANVYTCNHLAVVMAGLTASACALYGDCDDISPWVRMSTEKLRTMAMALGDDGASQESHGYGAFYGLYLLKAVTLVQELVGEDLFERCNWLRNLSNFYLYSALPGEGHPVGPSYFNFGDGARWHWHGLDVQQRKLAAVYRNPAAQWHADILTSTGYGLDQGAFLNLLWFDPDVTATPPDSLPTMHHFQDKDLVFCRTGWKPDSEVIGFRCGPHFGHHALRHYPHDIGGGHMCPDAGAFQIYAHGDRLIVDDGYKSKWTKFQNTMLINGHGQTGEGAMWFEGQQLRREKRGPGILRAESCETHDEIIADATGAYGAETGLKKFVRHFLYIKPSIWLIADVLAADSPSTFELYFHADQPFEELDEHASRVTCENGSMLLRSLMPQSSSASAFIQEVTTESSHGDDSIPALVIRNSEPLAKVFLLTALYAFPSDSPSVPEVTAEARDNEIQVWLNDPTTGRSESVTVSLDSDPRHSILRMSQ